MRRWGGEGYLHASPAGGAQMNKIVTSQCTTKAAMGVLNLAWVSSVRINEADLRETTDGRLDMTILLKISTSSFANSCMTTGTVLAIPIRCPNAERDTSAGRAFVPAVSPNTFVKRDAATVTLDVLNCSFVTPAK